MNTPSASPDRKSLLVWDAPVRMFHWLMALSFAGAYATAETETWRLVHITLGYTMTGLVTFRLMWGLTGTRYARFAAFVKGPRAVVSYLRALIQDQPEHHIGHNPAGAVAILLMLGLTVVIGATGWATYNEVAGDWIAKWHELVANSMLVVVGVHLCGVALASWLHRENLIRSMITGHKWVRSADGIRSSRRTVALVLLVAVLVFWWFQWQGAPTSVEQPNTAAVAEAGNSGSDALIHRS